MPSPTENTGQHALQTDHMSGQTLPGSASQLMEERQQREPSGIVPCPTPESQRLENRLYTARITSMGLLLAFALILSYIEILIPFQPGIPGIRLGLANLAVVLCLFLLGWKEALLLTITKAVLSGFLFGSLFMILYSLTGAVCSMLVMILLKRTGDFHLPVISAAGGVFHNLGQLLVAMFAVDTYGVLYYMPVLIVAGLVTGILIGITASLILPGIKNLYGRMTV